ncbi:glutaredoxin family protein [Gracilibacillus xinjiangensis]|uniref:Glutaredoxin family protein n=1 Tax=Gracilibacillus xinjiangensis TaxID=1193282 RepID=A0ABV8X0R1_9BACI
MTVKLYGKENCSICTDAKMILELLQTEYFFEIDEIDIYEDDTLLEKYHLIIPVIEVEGEIADFGKVDYDKVANFLKTKNY